MTTADGESSASGPEGRHLWLWAKLPLGLAIALVIVWELGVRFGNIPAYLLPPPTAILASMMNDWKVIYLNIYPTLIAILGGFALSVVVGIPLATIIVFSRFAERVLYPPMIASQAIPKVAVAPLFVVWMGIRGNAKGLDSLPDSILSGRHRYGGRIALDSAGNAATWTVDGWRHPKGVPEASAA